MDTYHTKKMRKKYKEKTDLLRVNFSHFLDVESFVFLLPGSYRLRLWQLLQYPGDAARDALAESSCDW